MRALTLALTALLLLPACATRTVNDTVVDEYGLEIRLRSQRPWLGGTPVPRGFAHPARISPARLETILGGIQIDMRESEDSAIRERRYAIPRKILPDVADGLSHAFAEAGPDQEIVVMALQKRMQKGIFNRKYLTSFVTWIEGDDLVVQLSRLDWKTDQHRVGDRLPVPEVGEYVMPFTTVPNELYAVAGRQGVRVAWQSPVFGAETIEENVAGTRAGADALADEDGSAAPLAEGGEAGATSGAAAAPASDPGADAAGAAVPGAAGAGDANSPDSTASTTSGTTAGATSDTGSDATSDTATGAAGGDGDALRGLTADDLRELADLEEARAAGRIDRAEYELQRQAILEGVR
jgi:hypothetical protein